MASNDYHLTSSWRVFGSVEDVFEIIADHSQLSSWWPSVFRDVLELERGDESGLGRIVRLETRGWLPYGLNWHLRVDELDPPHGFGFAVWGDFEGRGSWSLHQDGLWTNVTYDWQISAQKGLLRRFSPLLRPAFVANHRWAMAKGEESLHRALNRRRWADGLPPSATGMVSPPGPATYPGPAVLGSLLAAGGMVLFRRRRRPIR